MGFVLKPYNHDMRKNQAAIEKTQDDFLCFKISSLQAHRRLRSLGMACDDTNGFLLKAMRIWVEDQCPDWPTAEFITTGENLIAVERAVLYLLRGEK